MAQDRVSLMCSAALQALQEHIKQLAVMAEHRDWLCVLCSTSSHARPISFKALLPSSSLALRTAPMPGVCTPLTPELRTRYQLAMELRARCTRRSWRWHASLISDSLILTKELDLSLDAKLPCTCCDC